MHVLGWQPQDLQDEVRLEYIQQFRMHQHTVRVWSVIDGELWVLFVVGQGL